jgi:hypothetical protein
MRAVLSGDRARFCIFPSVFRSEKNTSWISAGNPDLRSNGAGAFHWSECFCVDSQVIKMDGSIDPGEEERKKVRLWKCMQVPRPATIRSSSSIGI